MFFMSVNGTFAVATRTSQGFAEAVHMSNDRQNVDPA